MCYARHDHYRAVRRPAEETLRQDPGVRASDEEREATANLLREHGAAGRLDVEELEQRVGAAYQSRTRGDLATLLDDLPRAPSVVAHRPHRPARHSGGHEWAAFVQVSALLIAIWALSGAGYFWPAWVMVWWACALVMRTGPRLLRPRRRAAPLGPR
jgi:Domain of unknown function (DUF1707)